MKLFTVSLCLVSMFLFTGCLPEMPNTLSLDKTTYQPGEMIEVQYKTSATHVQAWIGVIPSETPHGKEEVNDEVDISFVYLDGVPMGTKTLQAPERPGAFDLRLHERDDGGRELASVSFTVTE